jgi:hypothetical protein
MVAAIASLEENVSPDSITREELKQFIDLYLNVLGG